MPRSTDLCSTVEDLLEPYVDGELEAHGPEAQRVRRHTAACPVCARELALAARIRDELRNLPRPERIERPGVRTRIPTGGKVVNTESPQVSSGLLPQHDPDPPAIAGAWWPAAVMVIVLVVGAGFWWLGQASPTAEPAVAGLTADELHRAEAEARYALAQVARVSGRTGLGLRDDVLHRHILGPTARTVNDSLETMTGTSPGDPR